MTSHEEPKGNEDGTTSASPSEATQPENINNEIDYKAELEAERKRREQAEYNATQLRLKNKNAGENPDISQIVKAEVEKATSALREEIGKNSVFSQIRAQSSSPEEAELVYDIYNNRIVKTGDITADIQDARLLANRTRILRQNEELRRTVQSPIVATAPNSGAGQRPALKEEFVLTPEEQKIAKAFGLTAEQVISARKGEQIFKPRA